MPRNHRLRNSLTVCRCICLVAALTAFDAVNAQAPAKPLTQDELLRQIGSLVPAPARNSVAAAESTQAEVRGTSKPSAGQPLFAGQRGEGSEKPEKPEKRSKGATQIEALEATFDQKAHLAVFIGEVVVTDPEFHVIADKLTAYLKQDDKQTAEAAPTRLRAGPAPVANAKQDEKKKGGGLEKAIAEADPGKMVTVTQEKEEADGTMSRSIGHGRKVIFDSVTGDITLSGRPDVQQGINTCVATDDHTIMILNRDGHMRVTGPHKTVIKDQGELTK